MSLFLGKIHYWLFNKVLWFESLEDEIKKLAESKGLNVSELEKEINKKYGAKCPNKNLEDMIDTSNIHGWLQSKIHSAEGRMAKWTEVIISNGKDDAISEMKKIYREQGIKAAREAKSDLNSINAEDIFNAMNDYILDGMPCDRVNEVISSNDKEVKWERRICVHKDIWEETGVSVDVFYDLRSEWITAFVSEMSSDYEYVELNDTVKAIKRRS